MAPRAQAQAAAPVPRYRCCCGQGAALTGIWYAAVGAAHAQRWTTASAVFCAVLVALIVAASLLLSAVRRGRRW